MDQIIHWVVQFLGCLIMGMLWYRDKEKDRKIEKLETRLQDTREQYVHKDDLKDLKQELWHRFDKLEDLINEKGM